MTNLIHKFFRFLLRVKNSISVAYLTIPFRPFFRLLFSFFYFFFCKKFLGYSDTASTEAFIFFFSSDESSAQSNSTTLALPNENHAQEEPLEEPIPLPNLPFDHFNPFDPVDQFRLLNLDTELELFARIRLLESRLIEGLPPQLNLGEYEAMVRGFLEQTFTIPHYSSTLNNELFDIGILELKADLLEQLFNLLMRETTDRLNKILTESPFPERAIRAEALEFIIESLSHFNLNDAESNIDKQTLVAILRYWIQDIQQNGHQSAFYLLFVEYFKGSI